MLVINVITKIELKYKSWLACLSSVLHEIVKSVVRRISHPCLCSVGWLAWFATSKWWGPKVIFISLFPKCLAAPLAVSKSIKSYKLLSKLFLFQKNATSIFGL